VKTQLTPEFGQTVTSTSSAKCLLNQNFIESFFMEG